MQGSYLFDDQYFVELLQEFVGEEHWDPQQVVYSVREGMFWENRYEDQWAWVAMLSAVVPRAEVVGMLLARHKTLKVGMGFEFVKL